MAEILLKWENADGDECEFKAPANWEVCPRCRGEGKHIAPGIDDHGITAEEFAEDPDFAEAYWGGVYDVDCSECNGRRVVAVPDWGQVPEEIKKAIDDKAEADAAYWAEVEAERRAGA
jgi:hypothetical protein